MTSVGLLPLQPPFTGNREKIQQKIVKDKIKLPAFLSSEAHSLLKGVLFFSLVICFQSGDTPSLLEIEIFLGFFLFIDSDDLIFFSIYICVFIYLC